MRNNIDPAEAFERRRGELERIGKSGAQYFKVSGEIEVHGTGEAALAVSFPVYFVDKPLLSVGFELGPGQAIVSGNLPVCSATVLRWEERVRADGTVIYSGALFGMVTSGPAGQMVVVQWHMEGIGLRGPVPQS